MSKKKVLVVDDEQGIIAVWEEALDTFGHEVFTANNGDRAIDQLKKVRFDLVLTDINMPGSDGFVILDYFASIEEKPKIIVSTGQVESLERLNDYSIERVIMKPFDLIDELNYINNLLT
ncbi:MAG: response regulator [Crocinitomicaceae bacterium]|nr:response regulator [Crocinitomicaceae bacterium]